jgi:hypothetical protein
MPKAPLPTKMILRRRSPVKTKVAKAAKSITKAPAKVLRLVAKKAVAKKDIQKSNSSKDSNLLEIGLLLDCTGSMSSWIGRAKNTLKEIVSNVVNDN